MVQPTALERTEAPPIARTSISAVSAGGMAYVNRASVFLSSLALMGAALTITSTVVMRHLFHVPTDWQEELSAFLLVGATFMTTAAVQAGRGHVSIELVPSWLGQKGEKVRRIAIDVCSLLFCAFFAWKSWILCHEAWVDGQVTATTWGPPLWIPYLIMSLGMSLLAVQIAIQLLASPGASASAGGHP